MLVEPKISMENYYKSNDLKMITILDTIAMDYAKRIKALTDKRRRIIETFLSQMKES
jgi:hypothetical protein